MDYEKKYKEALERARKLQENSNGMILKKWLWNIFPELEAIQESYKQGYNDAINKACEWITQHIEDERYKTPDEESYRHGQPYDYFETNMFIDDFRKAMEEQ